MAVSNIVLLWVEDCLPHCSASQWRQESNALEGMGTEEFMTTYVDWFGQESSMNV